MHSIKERAQDKRKTNEITDESTTESGTASAEKEGSCRKTAYFAVYGFDYATAVKIWDIITCGIL